MLLTEAYRAEQAALHERGNYGTASLKYGEIVSKLVRNTKATTLLDYGCGAMRNLAKVLDCDVEYEGYDPAVPDFAIDPDPAEFVVSIDVLEHIEPECLEAVLDHIRSKTLRHAFLTIHTGPAVKVLSDGRNAHLIQEGPEWWLPKIMTRWKLLQFSASRYGFHVFLTVP